MIYHITLLLAFQLAGEVASRGMGLTVPGPVLGMALFLIFLIAAPRQAEAVRPTAQGLLSHLSLLFVPAGVGVVGHIDRLGTDGLGIIAAVVISTALAMVVAALVFVGVARLVGSRDV